MLGYQNQEHDINLLKKPSLLEVVSECMGEEVEISRDESPEMDEDGDEPTVEGLL